MSLIEVALGVATFLNFGFGSWVLIASKLLFISPFIVAKQSRLTFSSDLSVWRHI